MSKQTFPIDDTNMKAVKSHIKKQFTQLSWWPAEQPLTAKEEFDTLPEDAKSLVAWCEKWLDSGQWRQLKIALK